MLPDPVALALAFTAGVLAFFSPCSVALLPAYLAWFVGLEGDEDRAGDPRSHARAGVGQGLAAAAGALGLLALAGLLVVGLGALLRPLLGPAARAAGLLTGLVLVVLGVLMALDRAPSVQLPLRAPRQKTVPAVVAFGALFAVGSVGCTLPLFLAVVANALQAGGAVGGLLVLLAYAVGMALLLLAATVAIALTKGQAARRIRRLVRVVRPGSALLLVLSGLYLLWYYLPPGP